MNLYTTTVLAAALIGSAHASCFAFDAALTGGNAKTIKETHAALKAADIDMACLGMLSAHAPNTTAGQLGFFKKYPNILARGADSKIIPLTSASVDIFAGLKDDVIARFFKKNMELQCENLDKHNFGNWNHMMKKKKLADLITPACLAQIPDLDAHNAALGFRKEHIKNLPAKVFSQVTEEINSEYFTGMTGEQLKNFQSHKDLVDASCSDNWVRLDLIKPKLLEGVTPRCFQNWVVANINTGRQFSLKHAEQAKVEQLSKADYSVFVGLKSIFADDGKKKAWERISKDIVAEVAGSFPNCATLTEEAVHSKLAVDPRAFAYMAPKVQGKILAKVEDLPDDLFKYMIEPVLLDMEYDDTKGKRSCKGYACLKMIRDHKNIAKIMSHLDTFMCQGKTFADFAGKEKKILGQYMSRACWKDLEVDIDDVDSNISDVHENMLQYLSVKHVMKLFDSEDNGARWRDLAQDYVDDKSKSRVWPGLLRNRKLCAHGDGVRLYTFQKLEKAGLTSAMDAFSSECLRVLPVFDKLTPAWIAAIGDQIYTAFTKSDANKIDYGKSSAAQLGNASARVENIADHYATTLTTESVQKIPVEVWPLMNAGYFEAMTAEAYAGISKAQFEGVPAERLTKVTSAQLAATRDEVKKNLTPEQITFIGSVGGPKSDAEMAMLAVLGDISGSFNEHQLKAFMARKVLSSGAMSAASASLMALVASLALIFPLL